jgi:hypothetical protein
LNLNQALARLANELSPALRARCTGPIRRDRFSEQDKQDVFFYPVHPVDPVDPV